MLDCIICIDDVNPAATHRLLGTDAEKWLSQLNSQYGCKFTLFVPANFHMENPISENKEWARELLSVPYFEISAHGYAHDTIDRKLYGECEFAQPLQDSQLEKLLTDINDEWSSVDHTPIGWRNPGWLCSPVSKPYIEKNFKYVALHSEHNRGMYWSIKEFFGHTGIHLSEIDVQDSRYIAFQSHVYGSWNDNTWTQNTFDAFRNTIDFLTNQYDITFKTFKELL